MSDVVVYSYVCISVIYFIISLIEFKITSNNISEIVRGINRE